MKSTDHQSRWLRLAKSMKPNAMVKALSGAPLIWLFLPDDGTPAVAIHRMFSHHVWGENGFAGRAVLAAGSLFTLPVMLALAGSCTWRCGSRARAETGKNIWRQMYEQMALGCRLAVPPPWYYMFEFYRDDHRRHAVEYLYRSETKSGVYDMIRRRCSSASSTAALRDKALFATRCENAGIAVVQTLAIASDGRIECPDGSDRLPTCDLFFKPVRGAGGRGASRWLYERDGCYRASDDCLIEAGALAAHLRELSRAERYLVRRHVRNHPALIELSPGALSTVRVLTCLDEQGEPEVTHAVLRMARSTAVVVDNFHAGGIAANVDITTGRLGPATDMGLRADSKWWTRHPVTGAPIAGLGLPHWPAVRALARSAHAIFDDQIAIGWDIAILPDGPCLIEGNKSPDLDIVQRVERAPAGNSRLGQLLAYHLRAVFADSSASH